MTTRARNDKDRQTVRTEKRPFRMVPMARAIALALAAGGMVGAAHAQRAFSPAWFANKGAVQNTAAQTGKLPNGMPASSLGSHAAPINANAARSIGNLTLAARGIAAQQAAQAAAREAALNAGSSVPDGLADGGLKVDTNSLTAGWINANGPVQTAAGGKTEVRIEQTAEKAILNWETFNVGKNTTVNFDQSKGTSTKDGSNTWIALNRINDPSGRPSEIAGQIKADGSVYLINRNGIIFNGSSQVNTRGLVASSLSLSDTQFEQGINNGYRASEHGVALPQFGDVSQVSPNRNIGFESGNGVVPDKLGGVDRFDPGAAPGEVRVDAGARLSVGSGGKLMLFAPKIKNAGALSAPDGQVILAAGENVFLNSPRPGDPNAVRGLDVAVSAAPGWQWSHANLSDALTRGTSEYSTEFVEGMAQHALPAMAERAAAVGYEVVNTGIVQSERGNITLQSRDIHQNGLLLSTTALNNRNGSILLRAWYLGTHAWSNSDDDDNLLSWAAGSLTLGRSSVTQIMPDALDTSEIETSALATRYQPGRIGLYGQHIELQPQAGVIVPSGTIDVESVVNPFLNRPGYQQAGVVGDSSRVYIDSDAFLSVAGLRDMLVPMSRNFIEAELRINELRDSPLLLNSWLRGKKIIVDRRVKGVFEDGPMAGVQWVLGPDGKTYIPGAWVGTPLADVAGWVGVGKTDLNELSADAGHVELRAGGSIITRAGSMIDVSGGSVRYTDGFNTATKLLGADGLLYTMDRALPGLQFVGIAGRYTSSHARWGVEETWASPLIGGNQREAGYTEGRKAGSVQIRATRGMVLEGEYAGSVVVGDRQRSAPASANQGGELVLGGGSLEDRPWSPGQLIISRDPHRLAADFNSKSVLNDDYFTQPEPNTPPAKVTWLADDVLSRSGLGEITFHVARDFAMESGAVVDLVPGASLYVGGGENSTIGIRVDGTIRAPGGSISLLSSGGLLELGADARLDASGQWINAWKDADAPALWAMDAGRINLNFARMEIEPGAVLDVSGGGRVDTGKKGLPALRVGDAGTVSLIGVDGSTDFDALDMRALAAGSSGLLTIQTRSDVQIGGVATDPAMLLLPASLFGERGFGKITVSNVQGATGDIVIADSAAVTVAPLGLDLSNVAWRELVTGSRPGDAAPASLLPAEQLLARDPTHLNLTGGTITVGAGASLTTGTRGHVAMTASGGSIAVRGTIDAPAGSISLTAQNITLEPGAQLLSRGVPAIQTDARGVRSGSVLAGGDISVNANSVLLKTGSLIDVSGASGWVDVVTGSPFISSSRLQGIERFGDAGTISISGMGAVESTLLGHAGPGALGGRLHVLYSPPDSSGTPPAEQLKELLTALAPDGDWASALGVDHRQFFEEQLWIFLDGPLVFPVELLPLLEATDKSSFVVSDTALAGQGTPPIDPASLGFSDATMDALRDQLWGTDVLRDLFQSPPGQDFSLTLRPAAFQGGGFADLALTSPETAPIVLDGVALRAGRSITVAGDIVQMSASYGGTPKDSSLTAAYVALGGGRIGSSGPQRAADGMLSGNLTIRAQVVDIEGAPAAGQARGARIQGFADTRIEAQDLRLGSGPAGIAQAATLDVDGNLWLKSAQIYPASSAHGTVRAGDLLRIETQGVSTTPLSAGGRLTLKAPVIEQGGVLRAPFGAIELDAGERLVLGAGSVTSVSGAGLTVPYGMLSNNEHWRDPTFLPTNETQATDGALTAPPEKRITLTSPDIALDKGAVVDIAGGGDLYAWEFVPGPGGSHDVLAMPGMYAVLPGHAGTAPIAGVDAGRRIWLAGGPGLAEGWYTLLPARYALLPGAFAVQTTGASWDGPVRAGTVLSDGSLLMQGKGGNSHGNTQDTIASAWRVMSGDTLRKYSEYNEAFANDFFSSNNFKLTQYRLTGQDVVTPRLARDGGSVVFDASQRLVLEGTLRSAPDAGGRGGLVDITGQKIAIVGADQDASSLRTDGYLVIDATSLSNFGAGSLLVGGKRQGDPLGLRVEVTATDVIVSNGAASALFGPEIILAASEQVDIQTGSVIRAEGTGSGSNGSLFVKPTVAAVYTDPDGYLDDNWDGVIDAIDAKDDVLTTPASDWGALVRVANGEPVKVVRENVDTTQGGLVRIGAGALIDGGASLLIDATRTTELASSARIAGADLSVAAGRIGFGGGTEGMVLDNGALAQMAASKHLTLRSYSSFDFHDSVNLASAGLTSVTLDGASFVGHGGDVRVVGQTIALMNSGNAGIAASTTAHGHLVLDATTLVLGAGRKSFAGFDAVEFSGRDRIVGEGTGAIDTDAAALTLRTPLLTGRSGAAQSVTTRGALEVLATAAMSDSTVNLQDSLGSRLALTGASVRFGGRAVALGGSIDMTATAGMLAVDDGAEIDVGGFAKQFFDVAEYADAGRINLSTIGGDVVLSSGSRLNLAAHAQGGRAGTLSLTASGGGTVMMSGSILAQAPASGAAGQGGSFLLDIAALPDFAAFSERLNVAGFNRSRQFRIRQGDVVIGGTTTVEDFGLTADQGHVDIVGTVDARSGYGGAILIVGGNGLSMQSGAQLLAGAGGEFGSGRVALEAAGGQLDLQGGRIDVSGADGGKVRLRAQQNASHNEIAVTALRAEVAGARSTVLEGVSRYTVADGGTVESVKAGAIADATLFNNGTGLISARLGTPFTIAAGIEIASAGDLAMNSDWNLLSDFADHREGTLTLRAGGNLAINGHLSDGFDNADRTGNLQPGASWNLHLVAGADLTSADALALKPLAAQAAGKGNIVVGTANTSTDPAIDNGAGKLVRTGTGDIHLRTGRDVTLAHKESVIYTAGRQDTTVWGDFSTANPEASYGIEGGHLDIRAQGSIEAQHSGQRFTEWLNRQGSVNPDDYYGPYVSGSQWGQFPDGSWGSVPIITTPDQPSWWVNHGTFQQGVGALGGGNVVVRAGGDLGNLGVSLATNMRMRGGRTADEAKTMELRNGGAMTVEAGGAIRGGQYYVARGMGDIRAGETAAGHEVAVAWGNQGQQDYRLTRFSVAPVIALGDATMSLRTAGDLRLQTVVDPLLIRYGDTVGFSGAMDHHAYMSGYTGRTALTLASTGGDVTLVNQAEFIFHDVNLFNSTTGLDDLIGNGGNRFPALLHVTAMNGGVEIQGPTYVMPGTTNDVRVLAQADVWFNNQDIELLSRLMRSNSTYQNEPYAEIIMSRATAEMMPSPFRPISSGPSLDAILRNEMGAYVGDFQTGYYRRIGNPEVLPLMNDYEPSRIYAAAGSIINADVMASEQTWMRAGTDIRGMRINARNLRESDVTLLEAGNDILAMQQIRRVLDPQLFDYQTSGSIAVQGPGALVLSAGRDIYADRLKVQTLGNQRYDGNNRPSALTQIAGLPEQGAAITVMAGMNQAAGYEAFASAYLDPSQVASMPDYLKSTGSDGTVLPIYLTDAVETRKDGQQKTVRRGLVSYMESMTGEELEPLQAWARFQELPALAQQQFLRQVYLLELREAGRDQNQPGTGGLPRNGGYNRGYAAIATLFPGDGWKGDVAANKLMLRTMAGGDIGVLTPGGGLQLAALGSSVPAGYGLVTLASGHINVFAKEDVVVNRSRILSFVPEATRQGSDQIIWSTKGDIDAGRGSKTVRVPSAPEVVTDLDGFTSILEKSDMSGSGIGTVGDGDVDLIAPEGTINAGDAGIRSAGNLNLAALHIVNADNIATEGEITGLPAVVSVNIGALTAASAAASQASAAAQEAVQRERVAARGNLPSVFTVRVLGFGNESMESGEQAPLPRSGLQSDATRYREASPVQIVGLGRTLDSRQVARLTPEERRLLLQDR